MRSLLKILALAVPFMALGIPAVSQMPPGTPTRPGREQLQPGFINVNLNLNLSTPFDEKADLESQVEAAQRRAYGLASKQCEIIISTIATSCSIVGLSSNVSMQRPAQMQNLTVGVQVSLAVKLKDDI